MKNSYPLYVVKDIEVLSNFLEKKFNYKRVFESDWYIQLANKEQQLGLMIENSSNQPEFLHQSFNGQGAVLTIEVENVDSFYGKFEKSEILHDLVTEDWGQRHFIIQAPEKVLIDVVEYSVPEDYS